MFNPGHHTHYQPTEQRRTRHTSVPRDHPDTIHPIYYGAFCTAIPQHAYQLTSLPGYVTCPVCLELIYLDRSARTETPPDTAI